jgi:hexulose-6-phosphate isomerase
MQGRLSPRVDGKIQAFPARHWREEFAIAGRLGFPLMEWTLDHEGLDENPLMSKAGRSEIRALCAAHNLRIASLTGDCFMQAPFYKAEGLMASRLHDALIRILEASAALGIRYVLIPLVDNGRLDAPHEAERLHRGLEKVMPLLGELKIVFESDLPPDALERFIADYPPRCFGINYDIGNSASLGFDPAAEIAAYSARIDNVHVKDRLLHGTTVPLGTGNADLPRVFALLRQVHYSSNFILQTARAEDDAHAPVLCRYRDMVAGWLAAEA